MSRHEVRGHLVLRCRVRSGEPDRPFGERTPSASPRSAQMWGTISRQLRQKERFGSHEASENPQAEPQRSGAASRGCIAALTSHRVVPHTPIESGQHTRLPHLSSFAFLGWRGRGGRTGGVCSAGAWRKTQPDGAALGVVHNGRACMRFRLPPMPRLFAPSSTPLRPKDGRGHHSSRA